MRAQAEVEQHPEWTQIEEAFVVDMVLPCFACVCVHRSVCGQAMAQAPRSSAVVQCLRAEYDWVSREGRVPFYRNKEVCQL